MLSDRALDELSRMRHHGGATKDGSINRPASDALRQGLGATTGRPPENQLRAATRLNRTGPLRICPHTSANRSPINRSSAAWSASNLAEGPE
jgi:hypothetical protein